MPSVYRCQALKLPDSFSVFPELRGKNWVQGLVGEGERHRGADFVPHPNPQKDSAKDPGISGEASRPVLEPELRPEGRSSLRLGVRTGRRPAVGGPSPCALLTYLLALHCRLCSPEHLLLPRPLQKVLLQRSVPRKGG